MGPGGSARPVNSPVDSSSLEQTATWNQTFLNPHDDLYGQYKNVTWEQSSGQRRHHWNFPNLPGVPLPNTFYQTAYVPTTGMLYAVTGDRHNLYEGYVDDGTDETGGGDFILVSQDDGETWHVVYTLPITAGGRALEVDPNNTNIIFAAAVGHLPYGSANSRCPLLTVVEFLYDL